MSSLSLSILETVPTPSSGVIWPVIIITLLVFLFWAEDGSQNCLEKRCNNTPPSLYPNDSTSEMIDKIIDTVRLNHTLVDWRRAMIVALFITLLILLLFGSKSLPHGFTVFIVATMVFICVYFSSVWFQSHWFRYNDDKIEQSLILLRHKLSLLSKSHFKIVVQ